MADLQLNCVMVGRKGPSLVLCYVYLLLVNGLVHNVEGCNRILNK